MDCKRLQWQPLLLRQIDHRVDCVAPGPVETDFFLKGKTREEIAARAAGAPLVAWGGRRILPMPLSYWCPERRNGSVARHFAPMEVWHERLGR